MSLLLDALKKAAEKKARKSAESESAERTEVNQRDSKSPARQSNEQAGTAEETVEIEAHSLESREDRQYDATVVDHTEIEKTHLDQTHIDETQIDQTDIEKTEIDQTQIDKTDLDSTEIDRTELDRTELDITDIAGSDGDITDVETTEIKAVALDISAIETSSVDSETGDNAEVDPLQQTVPGLEDTITDAHTLTDEDKTLQFYEDDEDDEVLVLAALRAQEDKTQTEITDARNLYQRRAQEDSEMLTDDDVTEFMGDGLTAEELETLSANPDTEVRQGGDDTTITNSDSLSLTNIEYDELSLEEREDRGYPLSRQETRSDSHSGYPDPLEQDDPAHEFELEEMDGHRHENAEATATSATIDIEQLTSDETVTIKDSTSTRTFAPDNYDRTLLKLAESDVSRIFPGMRGESDTVMTPDYAKKVFLDKSQGAKHSSYKIYAGIAVLILMSVSVWGLFELQDESESIDQSLMGLKRDPMPGMIKPKTAEPSPILFPTASMQGEKLIGILADAGELESNEADSLNGTMVEQDQDLEQQTEIPESDSTAAPVQQVAKVSRATGTTEKLGDQNITSAVAQEDAVAPGRRPETLKSKSSAELTIISSSRVPEKDQILAAAYEAYEQGQFSTAARLYDQVLSLEPENRDARLGRAAIHVRENQAGEAIQLYQQLLVSNPKDSMAMTSLISVVNVDPQGGETEIKSLLREQPELPYLHFALGNMYGSQNRWIEAQSSYFTALQYKPNDPDYAYNLAVSLEHMQKPDTAITYYQRALENNSYGQASFDGQLVGQRIEVLSQ